MSKPFEVVACFGTEAVNPHTIARRKTLAEAEADAAAYRAAHPLLDCYLFHYVTPRTRLLVGYALESAA